MVNDDIIIQKLNPSTAIIKSNSGNVKIYILGLILEPEYW